MCYEMHAGICQSKFSQEILVENIFAWDLNCQRLRILLKLIFLGIGPKMTNDDLRLEFTIMSADKL